MRRVVAALGTVVLAAATRSLAAQQPWVPPKPPCDVTAGHFRVNSGQLDLKLAHDKPTDRDRMLKQAQDVLVRAIRDDKQDQNPGAWYYLGRYYYEVSDAKGADTAFTRAENLAPQCKADIATYRNALATDLMGKGSELWQAGKEDSAALLFRQSYALNPADPKPLFTLGDMYAGKQQNDSAVAVLGRAIHAAGTDTAYLTSRRSAMNTIARVAMQGVQSDPAVQRLRTSRYSRDSVRAVITNDSTILGRIYASSASRRARNARLMPADQKQFSADSTAREASLKRNRAAQDTIQQRLASDSAAAQAAFAPAIAAYQSVVAAAPADPDAAAGLGNLYMQAGRKGEASGAYDSLLNNAGEVPPDQLLDLGRQLSQRGLGATAASLFAAVLKTNPYHRAALFELGTTSVSRKDTATAVSTAKRLVAIEPANVGTLRLASQAWDLAGRKDSTLYYLRADSNRSVDISVASMVRTADGVTVTAIATNLRAAPSAAFGLAFEFLDAKGAVVSNQPLDIPALPPSGNQQLEVKGTGKTIVGWRYRLR